MQSIPVPNARQLVVAHPWHLSFGPREVCLLSIADAGSPIPPTCFFGLVLETPIVQIGHPFILPILIHHKSPLLGKHDVVVLVHHRVLLPT